MPKRNASTNKSNEPKAKKAKTTPEGSTAVTAPTDDFSSDAKTSNGNKWNLKIISWNMNGIRACMAKDGFSILTKEDPDVLCIQETKCTEDKIPEEITKKGYKSYFFSAKQPGYSGVGLLTKKEPISVKNGFDNEEHDSEGRVITVEYQDFYLVTAYVPNSGRGLKTLDKRMDWDKHFFKYLQQLDEKKPLIVCGDLNVAHKEIDLTNPKTNKKNAGFTQEERDGFSTLLGLGFVDSYRELYPEKTGAYTFWTYMGNARAKNVGWRLDYFLLSKRLQENLCDNLIRSSVMGSDHCPITLLMHMPSCD